MEPHTKFRAAQAVARFTVFHAYFRRQRTIGVSIEERLELFQCRNGLGLVALRCSHLHEVAHRQFVLRVIGALVPRIEGEELAIFVRGEDERFSGLLPEEAIADAELRVGAHGTLRVVVHDLTEVLAGIHPFAFFEGLAATVE